MSFSQAVTMDQVSNPEWLQRRMQDLVDRTVVLEATGAIVNNAVTTAKITDAAVTSAKISPDVIQTVTVTVTNAQIKALRAAPKTLVAAPGSGKYIEFISAIIKNSGGSNALTETTDNMAIKMDDGSGAQVSQDIEATGFIDQTAATVTNALRKIDTIIAYANAANKAIVLHNTGDGEYGGNAAADVTLTIDVIYRVHTI